MYTIKDLQKYFADFGYEEEFSENRFMLTQMLKDFEGKIQDEHLLECVRVAFLTLTYERETFDITTFKNRILQALQDIAAAVMVEKEIIDFIKEKYNREVEEV